MYKTIWKYNLAVKDEQIIELPEKSTILTVQAQNDMICLWALVNPETDVKERRCIRVIGTGHAINDFDNLKYISTVQIFNGKLVFGIFEKIK